MASYHVDIRRLAKSANAILPALPALAAAYCGIFVVDAASSVAAFNSRLIVAATAISSSRQIHHAATHVMRRGRHSTRLIHPAPGAWHAVRRDDMAYPHHRRSARNSALLARHQHAMRRPGRATCAALRAGRIEATIIIVDKRRSGGAPPPIDMPRPIIDTVIISRKISR